jgi:Tol biopolymer transport system component
MLHPLAPGEDSVYPAWSPDGTKIAFQRYGPPTGDIYLMNADGSGQAGKGAPKTFPMPPLACGRQ